MINWMICRFCLTLVPPGTNTCKCEPKAHLPKTQTLMTLTIPEGYAIVKVEKSNDPQ